MKWLVLICIEIINGFSSQPVGSTVWSRVVAIGDIHGDMNALLSCLRVAGVVDAAGEWIAEPGTCLISCGDILDRGDEDWECLKYLRRLKKTAQNYNGDVTLVFGNHEALNVLGDMRFVSEKAMFATARDYVDHEIQSLQEAEKLRIHAFRPGGPGALLLADLCGDSPVAKIIGDTLFCHGGLHLSTLDNHHDLNDDDYVNKLSTLNSQAKDWLLGCAPHPTALAPSGRSPVWSRVYSNPAGSEPSIRSCNEARDTLNALGGLKYMVVGHTPQLATGINHCCSGVIYRIDTGASAFYGGKREALEFRPDQPQPRILSPTVRFDFF
mmetsp:Transcript_19080/g.24743  ORF Transcript_19080/g.24743 Transcript_19080/m.24743 type:complete len:325 (-) Transcript_19080:27-1001(-)